MEYAKEREYIGNRNQVFRVLESRMVQGREDGTRILQIQNGSGLELMINADRGMDLPFLSYKGQNISYIAPCGLVAPQYFEPEGIGFLRSFTAGFLTTCGLLNAGNPGEFDGKTYGLHGRISHIPAREFSYQVEEGENPTVSVWGKIEEGSLFENRLTMHRNIRCSYRQRGFTLTDTVENQGFSDSHHMILYHMNLGYPLLDENAEIFIPSRKVIPRNEEAAADERNWKEICAPKKGYIEKCYYHELELDDGGFARVGLYQSGLGIGVGIRFDGTVLDHFVQWKMMGQGDYVLGLEPCNCTIDGLEDARRKQNLKVLGPREKVTYRMEIFLLESEAEFERFKRGEEFYGEMV